MKRLNLPFAVLAFALLAMIGLPVNTAAQNTSTDPVPSPCPIDVDVLRSAVQAKLDVQSTDADDTEPEYDITCNGFCDGGVTIINGVRYVSTYEKFLCVTELQRQGVKSGSCFALLCGSEGVSDLGTIKMNESEDVPPSHVILTSANGEVPFQFPAKVRIEFYANMDLHGLPQLSNQEPMVLESVEPVTSWPPKNEVDYQLVKSVDFVSADGKDVATFESAIVTMKNSSEPVSAR